VSIAEFCSSLFTGEFFYRRLFRGDPSPLCSGGFLTLDLVCFLRGPPRFFGRFGHRRRLHLFSLIGVRRKQADLLLLRKAGCNASSTRRTFSS
jgi:hypothetical protein